MPAAQKRASPEMDAPRATRSKRSKYSSIACEACRKSKLKCEREPGSRACNRCISKELCCNISRPQRDRDSITVGLPHENEEVGVRLRQCEQELDVLRRQVVDLTSTLITSNDTPLPRPRSNTSSTTASSFDSHGHVEPHFVGSTRPVFNLKMAKASLAYVMDDGDGDEDDAETETSSSTARSQPKDWIEDKQEAPSRKDPLQPISIGEAQRLVAVFRDEIQTVYPILDPNELTPSRIRQIYNERSMSHGARRYSNSTSQRESQLLRTVLAIALVLETPNQKAKLHRELVESVEPEISSVSHHPNVDLISIRIIVTLAIYHFFCDQELYAWRTIGIAARLALEMGLHRKESLLEKFPDPQSRTNAVSVFWSAYVLDRQCSLENGLSFAVVDRDIDPELPQAAPDHLKSLIAYGRLCSKVWEAIPQFSTTSQAAIPASSQLDWEIQSWLADTTCSSFGAATTATRGTRSLHTLTHLRGNHLRLLINRQYILSSTAIATHPQQARLVVDIAQDTTRSIVSLSQQSDIYARQQAAYNHFLVSALGIILLAVGHAPAVFAQSCREDFAAAIELVKSFSDTSVAGRRLWKSMCGLVSAVGRLNGLVGNNRAGLSGEELGEQQEDETSQVDSGGEHRHNLGLGLDSIGPGLDELFDDPEMYSRHDAQPDMTLVGGDLMGLFDAFGQSQHDWCGGRAVLEGWDLMS